MGVIFANMIYWGKRTFDSVPNRFKEATKEAFFKKFGITVEEWEQEHANH